ncbi:KRAB [Mytilus edulis]|uniref:KRAB n=1 Tax=Mytilus edulis TaxID=6550 RepID=A0A8S3TT58_MYTED|nr:KRAB [Mytilus edulis]
MSLMKATNINKDTSKKQLSIDENTYMNSTYNTRQTGSVKGCLELTDESRLDLLSKQEENKGGHVELECENNLKVFDESSNDVNETSYYEDESSNDEEESNDLDFKKKPYLFKCKLCGKRFQSKDKVKLHMSSHTGEKQHSCQLCDTKCMTQQSLYSHIVAAHPAEAGDLARYSCDVCGKKFYSKCKLLNHSKTHFEQNLPYQCKLCPKRFSILSRLMTHIKTHTGDGLFTCKICDKAYTTQASLKSHMNNHTHEIEYKCETCNKVFYTNGGLIKHRLTHSDDRPLKCSICCKGFKQNSHMRQHMESHKPKEERKPKKNYNEGFQM